MKTMYFKNFDEFEAANVSGRYELTTIVRNEKYNTLCADLMTDCKSYKTALNRFFKSLQDYPQFMDWKESLFESCKYGCFEDAERYWNAETQKSEYQGGWHYTIEDNDGSFYIALNVLE